MQWGVALPLTPHSPQSAPGQRTQSVLFLPLSWPSWAVLRPLPAVSPQPAVTSLQLFALRRGI